MQDVHQVEPGSGAHRSAADKLRALLSRPEIIVLPSCFDALGAKLIEGAGFNAAFMSGFAVSASQLAMPDVGVISYSEMLEAGRHICGASSLPIIGDADTGFGNVANVQRTVHGYAQAGFAAIMIEDQIFPKRCAAAKGVQVVSRQEATSRIRAARAAQEAVRAAGGDILLVARTDCRHAANVDDGLAEALWRCQAFEDLGAEIVYFEGPKDQSEMERLNRSIRVPTLIAQVERPGHPVLSAAVCQRLGFKLQLFGLTMLSVSLAAQKRALQKMRAGNHPSGDDLLSFDELYETVGFNDFYKLENEYS
eukprot:jgi/Mesvir1/23654/Mv18318-RA.3